MTYRLEGFNLGLLRLVVKGILHVIRSNATGGTGNLGVLRDTFERAVPCTEVEDSGPIVRKVLAEGTSCARRFTGHILLRIHGGVERILARSVGTECNNISEYLRTPPTI